MWKNLFKKKVKLLFKSGNSLVLEVDEIEAAKNNGGLVKLTWKNASPNILYISLESIEAIVWK